MTPFGVVETAGALRSAGRFRFLWLTSDRLALSMFIRIVKRPLGEAPEWVRDAWIGVLLPTPQINPIECEGFGVLSGPKGPIMERVASLMGKREKITGYVVLATDAFGCLESVSPAATAWWRENCPHLDTPGSSLMFRTDECELVSPDAAND